MSGSLRVAFMTHAGPIVGLGHVSRCLALARAFTGDRPEFRFVVSPDERLPGLLRQAGVEAAEAAWEDDPTAALQALGSWSPDVVVVDSYAVSLEFLAALRGVAGQVVVVDDLADRPLPAHIVVNGGIGAEQLPYRGVADTLFLLGPRYALVDPQYAEGSHRKFDGLVRRLLVSLGGGAPSDAVVAALAAADAVLEGSVVDLALGPYAPGSSEREAAFRCARNRIVVHRSVWKMRALMLGADAAISGAGMTLYELAATATPTIAIQMADNQTANVRGFAQAAAALTAGAAADPELKLALETALRHLVGDPGMRAALGARARELVDGQGALRVAREIARLAPLRR